MFLPKKCLKLLILILSIELLQKVKDFIEFIKSYYYTHGNYAYYCKMQEKYKIDFALDVKTNKY